MKRSRLFGIVALLTAAFFWGVSFSTQKVASAGMGPLSYNALRFSLGALFLFVCAAFRNLAAGRGLRVFRPETDVRKALLYPLPGGVMLFLGMTCQQTGLIYEDAGKGAFLSSIYIVFVALMGLFLHRRLTLPQWCGVGLSLLGLFLISAGGDGFSFQREDLWFLFCALFFAGDILWLDRFGHIADSIAYSAVRLLPTAVLSFPFALFTESLTLAQIRALIFPILYGGLIASGLSYTLQVYGQKRLSPVLSSILMTFEAIFAALSSWLFLGEKMTAAELSGCGVMFAAALMVQTTGKKNGQKLSREGSDG